MQRSKIECVPPFQIARGHGAQRLQSTHSGGGGGSKVLIATAGATSLVAGVVGYAAWNNDNRKVRIRGVCCQWQRLLCGSYVLIFFFYHG